MKQTMLPNKESPLLDYAISRLNPEVFSHPVWVRFCKKAQCDSPRVIEVLLDAAQKLQGNNPSDACQLMLVCSVFQNYTNRSQDALTTIQNAVTLAKRTSLTRELLWANWGASAICVQQGNNELAATHLDALEIALSRENEWILANFVGIIKQALVLSTKPSEGFLDASAEDNLIQQTFLWLQQWGLQSQFTETEFSTTSRYSASTVSEHSKRIRAFFTIPYWQDQWHTLTLIFKEKNQFSRIRSLLPSHSGEKNQHQTTRSAPQDPGVSISHPQNNDTPAIPMTVQMLGGFNLTIQNLPIKLPNSRGVSLLKYLLLHHKQDTPRDVLMDIFWPDADPEAARNDLNVAMHGLRQSLRSNTNVTVIRFENGAYGVVPNLEIWFDVEEFEHCIKEGKRLEAHNQLTAAITEYEIALNLYQGDFLVDIPYDSWTTLDRERLRVAYLDTLDHLSQIHFGQSRYVTCVTLCQLIINRDPCREDAHCRLMRAYSRLGQGSLALRQYHVCVEALQSELEVDPEPETTQLFEQVRLHRHI